MSRTGHFQMSGSTDWRWDRRYAVDYKAGMGNPVRTALIAAPMAVPMSSG
jgi:hypothetical protein